VKVCKDITSLQWSKGKDWGEHMVFQCEIWLHLTLR